MTVVRHPSCPVCGKNHECHVDESGDDRMTVLCGECGNRIYFNFREGKLVDKGQL